MLYAIIADIHSNLAAFEAVLQDIKTRGKIEQIWCLGDIVGYGPDPHQCIELIHQYNYLCVAGNHDWAAIGAIDTSDFNSAAAVAAHWTASQLTSEDKEFLRNLPLTQTADNFTLTHGSPRDPIWEYLTDTYSAEENLTYFHTSYCLIGHSHIPLLFEWPEDRQSCGLYRLYDDSTLELKDKRLMFNPGSVGQPRDGDPRASYAIYNSENRTVHLFRLVYEINRTQSRMLECSLPQHLITRLSYGR